MPKKKITKFFLMNDFSPGTESHIQMWMLRNASEGEVEMGSWEFWEAIENLPDHTPEEDRVRVMNTVSEKIKRSKVSNKLL